jgi:hypothetical protein
MNITINTTGMKGRKSFTNSEILIIKKLIAEKVKASTSKQKHIRQKIRDIGFYFTDFYSRKQDYTVACLQALINSKTIKVLGK